MSSTSGDPYEISNSIDLVDRHKCVAQLFSKNKSRYCHKPVIRCVGIQNL